MANQPTWVTSRGSNSVVVTYPTAAALADIMDTIETWLVAHGWALHDASAGTNARAYKALHPDGVSYGYIVLDYNTAGHMLCKIYESWNATTHAGTNLAYFSDNVVYAQHIDTTNGGSIYINAKNAWAYFQSQTPVEGIGSSTGNSGCGYFAVARDNPEDTPAAGYPAWVFISLNRLINDSTSPCSFPRTRDGSTGSSAAYTRVTTKLGAGGYDISGNILQLYFSIPIYANVWSGKYFALTVSAGKIYSATNQPEMKGRIYGLKIVSRNQGGFPSSDIDIKIDANDFYSPTGTLTGHWILTETVQFGRMALPK